MGAESPSGVRQRAGGGAAIKRSKSPAPDVSASQDGTQVKIEKQKSDGTGPYKKQSETGYKIALILVTIAAFITRFWKIWHPNQVVFDEVHFGKYLQGTYFFDVHPPFGKLLFAFMGWLVGYDGHFLFDSIGDSYIENKVPYVAFRAMPAMLSTMTVPVVFLTMWESGYSLPACLVSAGLMIFDNGHIGQTRLILLDSTLIFSMACSLLCYVRFYKQRHSPFGRKWWKWLLLTGVSLSCVISTKYVGVFTFVTIGAAVAIDLWNMLDIKRGLTLTQFGMHFAARAFGLIVIPFFFYLFWFQVHFTILYRSGPGDDFMTPEFQETLSDNIMSLNSIDVQYYDIITIRHKETKAYLHSHPDRYPLRYDDGRISSQGQQVTGYPFNDTNNHWIIVPADPIPEDKKLGRQIMNNDLIKLRHVVTNTDLLSHDVASPYYPTNQEFTTVSIADSQGPRHNDTIFEVRIEGKKKQKLRTMSGLFKLVHHPSKVAMWTHGKPLPDWGYKQQEINGNKNLAQKSNIWYAESIIEMDPADKRNNKEPKKVKHMSFFRKYFELQRAMFHHNNALTSSHPYASQPIQWPFLMRGVSFWTKNDTREQIYFLGNIAGWWIASSILAVFAGIVGADQLSLRRGDFFWLAWAAHYFPFFLMGRQLFLHHYLPAHLASTLVTGGLVEFVFGVEPTEQEESSQGGKGKKKYTPKQGPQSTVAAWIAGSLIIGIVVASFVFYAPLTYGSPGLSVEGVLRRKWLGYDLHFAK
ncbi:Dolichyl-phosphate-mannose-protein mannosyltransferase-domain-containing protein [Kalaharituber pfeilii]|nr:Dolichyl-phosphate-mannose-protein mannosyltransferase-domain-containing protein [Kalaharituber pfeilii]